MMKAKEPGSHRRLQIHVSTALILRNRSLFTLAFQLTLLMTSDDVKTSLAVNIPILLSANLFPIFETQFFYKAFIIKSGKKSSEKAVMTKLQD
jgi:hypothetical protein